MIKLFIKFSYGNWLAALISFFTTPIITLLILPDEFGKASLFTLALNFILQIVLLGVDQGCMRFFYSEKEEDRNKLVWLCTLIAVGWTVFFSFFLLLFWKKLSVFITGTENVKIVLLLVVCVYLSVIERFVTTVVRMQQNGNVFSVIRIVNSCITAFVVIVYAKYVSPDFYAIVYSSCIALLVSILISILYERKFWRFAMYDFDEKSRNLLRDIFKYSLPLVPIFIIAWLFEGMDKIALSTFSNFKEIGLYTAASKIIAVLTIVQTGFSNFWVPVALETYEKDNYNYVFFENAFKIIATVMLSMAAGLILFRNVIVLLFASSYREAACIMPFLVFIPVMYILSETTGYGIGFKKKTYLGGIALVIASVVNLAGNYFLTPAYGARGAAFATGIAFTVYFIVRTFFSVRLFPAHYPVKNVVFPFIVLFVMAFVNTFLDVAWWLNCIGVVIIFFSMKSNFFEIAGWLKTELKKKNNGSGESYNTEQ
ncbi:MAG: oligosaccharide flippase family protein [Parabacteroides sp.]|nr:oligosaccharide flippase family protein [Parabacteroides sp.]